MIPFSDPGTHRTARSWSGAIPPSETVSFSAVSDPAVRASAAASGVSLPAASDPAVRALRVRHCRGCLRRLRGVACDHRICVCC
ncbi:hypothetical protein Aph02nite_20740 [Actinoplanes philippinensis]|nr:hypothetical protein Aph02nite_20740 [Actinoplanes philippinensis]